MPLIDNQITRFPAGVTNVPVSDIFNSLRMLDPTIYNSMFDDFHVFTAAQWSVGGVGTPTRAVQAGLAGLVRLGTTAALNDNSWLQTANPTFQIIAGKELFFSARVQADSASLATTGIGLQIAVASNNFLTPANGIFFRKAAGGSTLEFVSRASSVETTSGAIATLVDATAYQLEFYYDGGTDLWGGINGAPLTRLSPAALPSVLMGLTIGVQAGSAVARNLDIDQVFIAQER